MNSKKAITLLVLATLLMTLVPVMPVRGFVGPPTLEDKDGVAKPDGDYGDTVVVMGNVGDVPGGTLVEIYWDDATHGWDGESGLLNSTTGDSDGSYEVWFDVPESEYGGHTVWVKAGEDYESAAFDVLVRVKPDSTSGEGLDKVDVDVYGQDGGKEVVMLFVDGTAIAGWDWVAVVGAAAGAAGDTEYDGDLGEIINPGSVVVTDGVETFTDNGAGKLISSLPAGEDGKINYVTGDWEVEFDVTTLAAVTIDYDWLDEVVDSTENLGTGTTNSLGSWSKRVEIPDWTPTMYYLASLDAKGNYGTDDFTIGAVLTATPDEVDVGDLVTVKGRGFTPSGTILNADVTIGGIVAEIEDYDDPEDIDSDGEFSFKVYVPQVPDADEDYDLVVTDSGALTADVEIEVEDKAKITITPDYGPQGATVSITGVNFPNTKEEDVNIHIVGDPEVIEEFETDSDGSFSGTFRIPAVADGDVEIEAYWDSPEGYDNIADDADFRIGSILVLLSDDEGPAGMEIILSGNGFTASQGWNATFGDEEIFEGETVDGAGLLGANTFYVPQVEPGTYDITVWDEDSEIAVITEFVVTHATWFEIDPPEAPAGFNVTLSAMYWSEDQGESFEFIVWNETDDWDITNDVYKVSSDWDDGAGLGPIGSPITTGDDDGSEADDGAALMWWFIGDQNPEDAVDVFSKGTYWLNVTYGDDYEYTAEFVVGDVHSRIAPRKSTFRIGDTLSFAIEHSFGNNEDADVEDGSVEIYDPSGNLYFETDPLDADHWEKSGMFYYVPISAQTDNANPMILLDDAPLGTWTYEWYEQGENPDMIASGTFEVAESTEDLITGKIDDLNNQITDLQDTVSDVNAEFDDIRSDIADVAAIAEQAVNAANAVADAVQTVAQTANQANTAAENAAEAANAAKDAANSLTTLVYGAIGAALVAALAAIVSLMQISRRIAG
jgi:tetrahydromethanopterin S-methyltransferase subunit B